MAMSGIGGAPDTPLMTERPARSTLLAMIAWCAIGALAGCVTAGVPRATASVSGEQRFSAQKDLRGTWGEQWGIAEFFGRLRFDEERLILTLDSARFDRFPSSEGRTAIEVRILLVSDERDEITSRGGFVPRLSPDFLPWPDSTWDSARGLFVFDRLLEYVLLVDCRTEITSLRPAVELKRGIGFVYAQGPSDVLPRAPRCTES